jgi:hypothetical protein
MRKFQNYSASKNIVVHWIRHYTANFMISKNFELDSKELEYRKFSVELPWPHSSAGSSKINSLTRTSSQVEKIPSPLHIVWWF